MESPDSFVELIEPTQLYNILNQRFIYPSVSDCNCLLLLDARETHEYNESHVVTAKRASKDDKKAFSLPYDAELECKQYVVVYDGTTDGLSNVESTAVKCAALLKEMGSRNPVRILNGGYEKFSALYPFLRTQKILWVPQELDTVETYPLEVIPGVLYIGDWRHGNAPYIQKDLKIKAHVNCTQEDAEFFAGDKLKLMNIPITDDKDSDLKQYLNNAVTFISMYAEKKEAVLVFSQLGMSRAAAVCIAYLMHSNREHLQVSYDKVRCCHNYACPNVGFLEQLERWQKETAQQVEQ